MKKEYEAFNGMFMLKIETILDEDECQSNEPKNDNAKVNNDDVPYEAVRNIFDLCGH